MRHVRYVIVLAVGVLVAFTVSAVLGAVVCALALLGAVITEGRYRRGAPGADTWSGRAPKR